LGMIIIRPMEQLSEIIFMSLILLIST